MAQVNAKNLDGGGIKIPENAVEKNVEKNIDTNKVIGTEDWRWMRPVNIETKPTPEIEPHDILAPRPYTEEEIQENRENAPKFMPSQGQELMIRLWIAQEHPEWGSPGSSTILRPTEGQYNPLYGNRDPEKILYLDNEVVHQEIYYNPELIKQAHEHEMIKPDQAEPDVEPDAPDAQEEGAELDPRYEVMAMMFPNLTPDQINEIGAYVAQEHPDWYPYDGYAYGDPVKIQDMPSLEPIQLDPEPSLEPINPIEQEPYIIPGPSFTPHELDPSFHFPHNTDPGFNPKEPTGIDPGTLPYPDIPDELFPKEVPDPGFRIVPDRINPEAAPDYIDPDELFPKEEPDLIPDDMDPYILPDRIEPKPVRMPGLSDPDRERYYAVDHDELGDGNASLIDSIASADKMLSEDHSMAEAAVDKNFEANGITEEQREDLENTDIGPEI